MIIQRIEHNRRRLHMQVHVCESRGEIARGLLMRRCPDSETAWLLRRCSAIHTCGLFYPIDVLFCDDSGRIVRILERVLPWRLARCRGASLAWEMRAGTASIKGWKLGDCIKPCE